MGESPRAISGIPGISPFPAAGWRSDHWYTKYSHMMYGIILQLTGNRIRAGRILKEVIMDLSRSQQLRLVDHLSMCKMVFQHSYQYTLNYLGSRGIKTAGRQPFGDEFQLLYLFYFEAVTVDDVAARLNKDKQEVLKDLRHELKMLQDVKIIPAVINAW